MQGSRQPECPAHEHALGVVARGLAAGFAGTLLLSVLARLVPWEQQWVTYFGDRRKLAANERGGAGVERAQPERAPSAAGDGPWAPVYELGQAAAPGAVSVAAMTPAEALAQASGPGPEGAAERFALKVSAGLFGRDLASSVKPAGLAVHVLYGSFWGAVYGIVQSSLRWSPALAGALHGLGVWAFGPGWLVPAMKLMQPPDEQTPSENATLIAGHLLYGLTVSRVFAWLARRTHDA
jgi:hypothetical protein